MLAAQRPQVKRNGEIGASFFELCYWLVVFLGLQCHLGFCGRGAGLRNVSEFLVCDFFRNDAYFNLVRSVLVAIARRSTNLGGLHDQTFCSCCR